MIEGPLQHFQAKEFASKYGVHFMLDEVAIIDCLSDFQCTGDIKHLESLPVNEPYIRYNYYEDSADLYAFIKINHSNTFLIAIVLEDVGRNTIGGEFIKKVLTTYFPVPESCAQFITQEITHFSKLLEERWLQNQTPYDLIASGESSAAKEEAKADTFDWSPSNPITWLIGFVSVKLIIAFFKQM